MKTILFIDNDYDTKMYVGGILKNSGYDVILVSNTLDALKAVSENSIDFIISDIAMLNSSGSDFLEAIQKKYNDPIPFMLISSLEYSEIEDYSFNFGILYYLKKPIHPYELLFYIHFIEKKIKKAC